MKKRILDFLIKIGKKCKPLTYPVMLVVIAFLTIYHAIRNLFTKENKWKSLVTGAICLAAVVGAVLVLPSLADEMTGESQTETVSEEELEPTMTPDVTVEPVVTEEPEEKQDSEETESAEETTKPEEEKKDGEQAEEKETEKTTVYYVSDEIQQSQYINMFKEQGMDAVILKHNIDTAFITHVEQKHEDVKFQRIDADLTDTFKEEVAKEEEEAFKADTETLTDVFRKALENDKLEVKVEKLKNENVASMVTLSEQSRRMQEMMKMYNMYGMDPSMFGTDVTLVLNANHPLVQYVLKNKDGEHVPMFCKQLFDLAMLSNKPLNPEEMTAFINRSNEIMMLLAK